MKKDPVKLYGWWLKKNIKCKVLDCNAEVNAKVKSTLGRAETVRNSTFFFFFQ